MPEVELLEIRDLNLGAALVMEGYEVLGARWLGRVGLFQFGKSEPIEKTIGKFYMGELLVDPQDFCNKRIYLKSLLYGHNNTRSTFISR